MKDRCRRTPALLDVVLAERDLTADELAHVVGCPACARALAEARAFERDLARIGHAVTPEPMPDASALLIARELERRETSTMPARRTLTLGGVAIVAALAIASLFLIKPPGAPEVAASPGGTAAASELGTPPRAVSPESAASFLGAPNDQVLVVPGGAVAGRVSGASVELAGVDAAHDVVPLTVVALPAAGVSDEASASGIVCQGGPFAGAAFVIGVTTASGEPSFRMPSGRMVSSPSFGASQPGIFVYALDPGAPRRTWDVVVQSGPQGGTGISGTFVDMPCDGTDPRLALGRADAAREADRVRASELARAAREAVTSGPAALLGVETCGDEWLARFWSPTAGQGGLMVHGGGLVLGGAQRVAGPDAPEVAALRASLGSVCRQLPDTTTQHDYDQLPVLDGVRHALAQQHGLQAARLRVAYLGPSELIVEAQSDWLAVGAESAEYVAVVRSLAEGWTVTGVPSADHLVRGAGIGLVRVGVVDGASGSYAVVYGTPATIDPVAVDVEVDGGTYRYPIDIDGFLAVVPAVAGQAVTYRYLDGEGTVVEEGVVPE